VLLAPVYAPVYALVQLPYAGWRSVHRNEVFALRTPRLRLPTRTNREHRNEHPSTQPRTGAQRASIQARRLVPKHQSTRLYTARCSSRSAAGWSVHRNEVFAVRTPRFSMTDAQRLEHRNEHTEHAAGERERSGPVYRRVDWCSSTSLRACIRPTAAPVQRLEVGSSKRGVRERTPRYSMTDAH